MNDNRTHILVTGSHRSGTTWVGDIISNSDEVLYVHEPFNLANHSNDSKLPFKYWYAYVSKNRPKAYQDKVRKYLETFYEFKLSNLINEITNLRSRRSMRWFWKGIIGVRLRKRIVFKDPIAFMSAEWLARELPAQVVVLIRHPAAFVASLKVKGWTFDFKNFKQQKDLYNGYLENFQDEIDRYAQNPPDIIAQGILLWNIIHSIILTYKEKHGEEWCFIKHEELSRNPVTGFQKIFKYLDLGFTPEIKQEVIESTTSQVHDKYQGDVRKDLKRISKENIKSWKKRLTIEEIEIIKEGTRGICSKFYEEDDW